MFIRHFDGNQRTYKCALVDDNDKVVRLFHRTEDAKRYLKGEDIGVSAESVKEHRRKLQDVEVEVTEHYRAASHDRMAAAAKRAELDSFYRQQFAAEAAQRKAVLESRKAEKALAAARKQARSKQ